ncbi:MAG: JAB domain-containing protein [Terrimicrobiaceae bacterium]
MHKNLPLKVVLSRIGEPTPEEHQAASIALDTAQSIFDFWQSVISSKPDFEPEKENLVAILLDTKLRPQGYHLVSLGTLNECTAHPREIFRSVIVGNSFAFVLAHNHPSGSPDPSDADRRLTATLRDGAALLQINLLDHVIIGNPGPDHLPFFSFRNAGLL